MAKKKTKNRKVHSFKFLEDTILCDKYLVMERLGGGWESEVYRLKEVTTGIELAGKFFFPHRNKRNKTLKFHAKKLHKLRDCRMVIQYATYDYFEHEGEDIYFMVFELVEGVLLSDYIARQKGKRLEPFVALHLLYALALGLEEVHRLNEYHGDLHSENIIVRRHGLGFDLKIIDMYSWDAPKSENLQHDLVSIIHIFHEALGGAKQYARHPQAIKDICCGLKRSLILSKFRTALKLTSYLENLEWT